MNCIDIGIERTKYVLGIEKLLIGKMHIMSQFLNHKIVKIAIIVYVLDPKKGKSCFPFKKCEDNLSQQYFY